MTTDQLRESILTLVPNAVIVITNETAQDISLEVSETFDSGDRYTRNLTIDKIVLQEYEHQVRARVDFLADVFEKVRKFYGDAAQTV